MVRVICGMLPKDMKMVKDRTLGLNDGTDQLAMANSIHWNGRVLRMDGVHVLRRAFIGMFVCWGWMVFMSWEGHSLEWSCVEDGWCSCLEKGITASDWRLRRTLEWSCVEDGWCSCLEKGITASDWRLRRTLEWSCVEDGWCSCLEKGITASDWRLRRTWKKQVEEVSMKAGLRMEWECVLPIKVDHWR